ncbi:MAG: hypothetical protein ACXVKA_04040 [Acidimicrobiia bacterium]
MPDATITPRVDHLGILLVCYLKDDDDLPLLELHLDRVAKHTQQPTTVFAAANRASPAARALLDAHPNVVVCHNPDTDVRGSREHGYHLDLLVHRALAAGVSHVCTLDVDSFPIRDDWVEIVAAQMPAASGLAAILRVENGDSELPHPSCTFATREFFERFSPSFSPDSDGTPEFRAFLRSTGQRADTGIRLGYALWAAGLPWGKLLRTNVVNPHYLMAGIYSDAVFHLGGIGRGKVFRKDLEGSTVHRLTRPLERLPVGSGAVANMKRSVLHRLRGKKEDELAEQNRSVFTLLRGWVLSDPDGLIATLRGQAPDSV